jgi:hypothetical protein
MQQPAAVQPSAAQAAGLTCCWAWQQQQQQYGLQEAWQLLLLLALLLRSCLVGLLPPLC